MIFLLCFKGLGGTEVVKPKCAPGVCFREDMCIETATGVECGPCPDGYAGDGFHCDDVDEVRPVSTPMRQVWAGGNCFFDKILAQKLCRSVDKPVNWTGRLCKFLKYNNLNKKGDRK